jgi:fatty acid desaturase
VIGGQLALLAASIALGVWRWYLLLWLLPMVTLLQALLRLRAVCEHGAVRDTATPWTAARTTLASPLVRWLVFPHDMNFHIEHHLYPSVPHYRLRDCHARLRAHGLYDGAELSPDFGSTLGKIFASPA